MAEPAGPSPLGPSYLFPDWPAPPRVRAAITLRTGGVSLPPFDSFNLGAHVGDDAEAVAVNRRRLCRDLDLPSEPVWLEQVHGCAVLIADGDGSGGVADIAVAHEPGRVCVVMTADCMPVLLCDRNASRVAAVHAGWRGLAGGVIGAGVTALDCDPGNVLAWLGPAIGFEAFEVGDEVRAALLLRDPTSLDCFLPSPAGRWLADLRSFVRRQLRALGVTAVYESTRCTFTDQERFFSYRRDGCTGRMASLIWLTP
jgi:YfiH family protein